MKPMNLLRQFVVLLFLSITIVGCGTSNLLVINGNSMEPTLQNGQKVIFSPVALSELQRGDLIYYKDNMTGNTYVKRLIGLPHEMIEIQGGHIYINNNVLNETYSITAPTYSYSSFTLGNDQYFVLGDNRNNSYDSHVTGPILGSQIIGKITEILK